MALNWLVVGKESFVMGVVCYVWDDKDAGGCVQPVSGAKGLS